MNQKSAQESSNFVNFFDLTPLPYKGSYITIGNFDGVHLGHQAIIHRMHQKVQHARQPLVVVTFFPDPSDFFNPQLNTFYLSTPEEKVSQLLALGVDEVVTFEFNHDFAGLSPEVFLQGLKDKLGLSVLVVGRDFALGRNRKGTLPVIQSIGHTMGFTVETIQPVNFEDQEISSTAIRERIDLGDLVCAGKMLGRPYSVSGGVTHGSDRGASIGLPTANILHWEKKKLPAIGVYATRVVLLDQVYEGITNVGFRPTFENQDLPSIETHILNFDGNIYGKQLEVQFIKKIRDEQKFDGVEAFLAQIERDKATARKIFNHGQP